MQHLNPIDAAFLQMESPRTPMHVGGLLTFRLPDNAPPDFLRALFAQQRAQLPTTAPFNQRLVPKRMPKLSPAWETATNIDIDYHLRHAALPYPGGERELGVLVARLHSHPLDLHRPPWEITLIEGLENRRFAFFFKVHHSAVDGMGALKFVRRWLSKDPSLLDPPALWALPPQEHDAADEADRKAAASRFRKTLASVRTQTRAAGELAGTLRRMARKRDNPEGGILSAFATPATPLNVAITPQRRLATQLFELSRIKALSASTGTTVNDVSLALIAGAVRRYLLELGGLPKTALIASVPVGLPRADGKPGNAVAGFVVPLETQHEDPLARLRVVRAVTQRTKEQLKSMSPEALGQFTLLGLSPLILGQLGRVLSHLPPIFNFVVSNVVASKEPLYIAGAELEAMYPISVLFDGYALNVTIVGYHDKLALGFTGCRDALPSLQRLAVYSIESLEELERAAGIAASATAATRGKANASRPGSPGAPARTARKATRRKARST
ncbi:WS/DGAT/MGAT family O-acyltransferase [Solimonas terrae]|uniref:diacylglycerol O-acyltransferase n=1 Tax=Solimonas terrae TaxID=1396819 RepID=A0A6M2BU15_9GAMM|nr:wax ester/triacylglycerol synthase family O-acyltransferase [Solimonas terrae]NGY05735.1 wax ester/triacylglycerol synthase family O-acyltransferase [Solimonas terrae]